MKDKKLLYAILIALFAISAIYQARFTERRLQYLFQTGGMVDFPINTQESNSIITYVGPEAAQAGVQKGDRLLSVNGQPFTGLRVLYDAFGGSRIGDPLTIRFDREGIDPREVTLQFKEYKHEAQAASNWIFVIVLAVIMPVFCMLLGFWVAARNCCCRLL
ncbi:MAG: PDZ domain-containing protein [Blastocatellia bacterium]